MPKKLDTAKDPRGRDMGTLNEIERAQHPLPKSDLKIPMPPVKPPKDDPHPWYGPCDAMLPDGGCAECEKVGGKAPQKSSLHLIDETTNEMKDVWTKQAPSKVGHYFFMDIHRDRQATVAEVVEQSGNLYVKRIDRFMSLVEHIGGLWGPAVVFPDPPDESPHSI